MKPPILLLGCGWIGLELGLKLHAQQNPVVATTSNAESLSHIHSYFESSIVFNLYDSDIHKKQIFESISHTHPTIESVCITIPFHRHLEPPSVYLEGMTHLMSQLLPCLPSLKRIYFTSSTSVYPENGSTWTEDIPVTNSTERSRVLLATEQLFLQSPYSAFVFRLAGLVGPGREPGKRWLQKTVSGRINLVHRDDVVSIISQCMESSYEPGLYNICGDGHPLKSDFYTRMSGESATPVDITPDSDNWKIVDNSKIKSTLGYTFKHAFS